MARMPAPSVEQRVILGPQNARARSHAHAGVHVVRKSIQVSQSAFIDMLSVAKCVTSFARPKSQIREA
jgi:hypothetical protein